MPEIVKIYRQPVPGLRFIGKRYGNEDRIYGNFGAKWGEWHENGWFDVLASLYEGDISTIVEDGDAYIGLSRREEGKSFEYWIGLFMPEGTACPEGFAHIDFAPG